jgi:hypothetical protein
MPILLTLLYFITYYLTPPVVFGWLAAYRPELILAGLLLIFSVPRLLSRPAIFTSQFAAVVGLSAAVFLSLLIGAHWAGGALRSLLDFLPSVLAFVIPFLHVDSTKKLRILVLMMLSVCVFVIAHGAIDLRRGLPAGGPAISEDTGKADLKAWDSEHPYVLAMRANDDWLYRLRGLGQINDPNDFGQLMVCTAPLLFIFWKKKWMWNFIFVIIPESFLLLGVFLTHSRGALIALVATAALAARRRIGTIPSAILAVALFGAALAMQFSGGRAISASAGQDRTALWGEGLQLLKSHPLFGVGLHQMQEYAGMTAHNSLIVVAAELGLFGLFFWILFVVPSVRDAVVMSSRQVFVRKEPDSFVRQPQAALDQAPSDDQDAEDAELHRIGHLMLLSLTGFLVAGLFLSRAYTLSLFLLVGMSEAVYEMGLKRGIVSGRMPLMRVLVYAASCTVAVILILYAGLRILNLAYH